MAEENDPSSKTEEASPRKLEEARRRGDVAKSPDVSALASLAAVVGVLLTAGGWLSVNLAAQLAPFVTRPEEFDLTGGGAAQVMRRALMAALPFMASVFGAAATAGVFGNLIQTGFLFSIEKLAPDLERLSPMRGIERMFGIDGLVNFLKSLLKIGLVGAVAWIALKPHANDFEKLAETDPITMLVVAADMLRALFFGVLALLAVGAALDWFWQKQRFMQRMRMSKEEMKEDFRQSEGDPHIKARLRQMRAERAKRRMMQNVPKATVVVMNPTHYAVALRYQSGETSAPVCVAKGLDAVALKIREVAEEANVPVVEDPPLARALYATVEIDETIPREHYEAVAKVIGFVMQTAKRRRARR
ncbi:MAG: flagellar biosynthesis protein FlhB [Caulobacteraceae bacterium]|nr:flagellar biosynthesis protein FlhB [Caulobacteraceae bacterium]